MIEQTDIGFILMVFSSLGWLSWLIYIGAAAGLVILGIMIVNTVHDYQWHKFIQENSDEVK